MLRVCMQVVAGLAVAAALGMSGTTWAAVPPDAATTALTVLPPGNGDVWGPTAAHRSDQIRLYDGLEIAAAAGTLGQPGSAGPHYKQAGFTPRRVVREERPRRGVLIQWDGFGVPYVQAQTIGDASFGTGWAIASGRFAWLEALRTIGRGGIIESMGSTGNPGGVRPQINYSDAELRSGLDELFAQAGEDEADLRAGLGGYVDGINAWLEVNRRRLPWNLRLPFGLGRLADPRPWRDVDVAAAAVVINDVFGAGGGGELGSARTLRTLREQLGDDVGMALYEDLRTPDPGATTHTDTVTAYPQYAGKAGDEPTGERGDVDPASIATPDEGTPVTEADMPRRPSMSNYIVLGGERTATGRPILIGGPQMGYWSPEIVMEAVVSTPDFQARGIAVPGLGPVLIAGRTAQYAWTPTSGGTDGTDVRAEELCEPDGGRPTRDSRHYRFRGACRAMERPEGAPANTAWRTVHGPVLSFGTVEGKPVGFAREREGRMSTPLSALGFYRMQVGKTKTAEQFVQAARDITLSLNLGYANADEIAYTHTGRYPVRAPGTRNDLPVWGTGEWEWRGVLDPRHHPFEIRPAQGFTASWNNVPAPGWMGEGWWGSNVHHRVDALEDRFADARGLTVDEAVRQHQDAATEDVEAVALVRAVERLLGDAPAPTVAASRARAMLREWVAAGAHRRDANRDMQVDAAAATLVAPLTDALMERTYERRLGAETIRRIPVSDNRPGVTGSAYQSGWFSPLARELDRAGGVAPAPPGVPVMCGGGDAAECRADVWASLDAAYERVRRSQLPWLRNSPHRWRMQSASILFLPVFTLPTAMRWQNRPTFEQVSAFG